MERWRNSAVAIVSHLADRKQSVGTGMLVASDLVLTASHVVNHKDVITGPVRLRWKSEEAAYSGTSGNRNNGYHDALDENGNRGIVWCDGDLDLALVRCNAPGDVFPVPLSDIEPGDNKSWAAEAYPKIGENYWKDSRYLMGDHGSCDGTGPTSRFTLIGVNRLKQRMGNDQEIEEIADFVEWSGASGAAVISLDHCVAKIAGVIVTEHRYFKTTLEAVPICEALKIEEFRALTRKDKESSREKCMKELRNCLTAFFNLQGGKEVFDKYVVPILKQNVEPADYQLIATLLAAAEPEITLNAIADIFDNTIDDNIKQSARALACSIATVSTGRLICPVFPTDSQRLLPMSCGSLTGVEIGMASVDGRAPEFRHRIGEGDLPGGKNALELPPEQGQGKMNALADDMIAKLNGTDILDVVAERTKAASPTAYLQTRKKRKKPSYYVPVPVKSSEDIVRWEEASERINVPHVYVATYDPAEAGNDEDLFGALREMLPLLEDEGF